MRNAIEAVRKIKYSMNKFLPILTHEAEMWPFTKITSLTFIYGTENLAWTRLVLPLLVLSSANPTPTVVKKKLMILQGVQFYSYLHITDILMTSGTS
jgi:hypothetical protein